jgi:hypothetical protein
VLNVHGVHDVKQMNIYIWLELLVSEPSLVEVDAVVRKLRTYKSLGTDQILGELITAGGETLLSQIHKIICSVWNEEEFPQQWKKSIVQIYKKGDKTNNYQGIFLFSPAYKILFSILLARLTPYVSEIIGDHLSGLCQNRPTTDQISKHWLFTDLKKPMFQLREKFCLNLVYLRS